MKIFGLCGRKQSGKDTFARLSCDLLQRAGKSPETQVETIALAEPLKKFCIDYLGLTREGCYGTDDQKNAVCGTWGIFNSSIRGEFGRKIDDQISNREVLQIVGTEVFRKCFRETFWIDLMKINLRKAEREGNEVAFVTDVRFKNEIHAVRELGGKVIRIVRDVGRTDQIPHASELEMTEIPNEHFDHVVANNSTFGEYCDRIEEILREEKVL